MIDLHDADANVNAFALRLGRWRACFSWAHPSQWPPYWWVWAGGVLAILAVLLGNAVIMSQFRRAALADARSETARLAGVEAGATDRALHRVDLAVSELVARLTPAAAGSEAAAGDAARRLVTPAALAEQLFAMPQLAALDVIGADGSVLVSSGPTITAPAAWRPGIAALRDHPKLEQFIGALPAGGEETSGASIYWMRRVNTADGAFAGVVVATLRAAYFENLFAAAGLGGDGAVSLRRDDGTLLAQSPPASAAAPALLAAIAARQPLQHYPLTVSVGMTEAAALAGWREEAVVLGGATIARVIVIGLITALLRRHLIAREQVAAARSKIEAETQARVALEQAVARSEQAVREHQLTEAALRESEQRFRDVVEVAADVIWETDPDHRFLSFSGGSAGELRRRLAIEVEYMVGKTRWELAGGDPNTDDKWRAHKAELDAHRPLRQFRYSALSPSGQPVYYSVNGRPIFDPAGAFLGYRGVGTNETEIVEARSRAERAETLLRDAVESISEGFVIYDREDRLALCNSAFLALYPSNRTVLVPGTRFEDIIREGLERGLYADAVGCEEEWFAKRLESHRNPQGAFEARHSNGRWLLICERPMRNGGIAGLRIDISAMKAAQAALRDSEERLNRAQRLAKMGCDTRDLRTGRMEWSDETFRIFGLARQTFVPSMDQLLALLHPDDRALLLKADAEIDRGVCPAPFEFRVIRPDNTIRHVARECELLCDDAGAPIMVAGTMRDVTDLRASQARQSELERQLQHSQKMKALGTLAGGIAHDLNNTLVPILSLSKMVAERMPEGSVDREDIEMISFASERARDLLQQILMFSRNQVSVKEAVDLASLTRKALQMLRVTVPAAVRLVEEIDAVPDILGDAAQLQRVIVNLVTNSIQAIGKQPGTVTVTVAAATPGEIAPERSAVVLSVADTGCGMDATTVERIFEPFYTTKRVGQGTGLGLSVVHGIVTDHGGRIEVNSKRRKGTVFKILLPVTAGAPASSGPTATPAHDDGIEAVISA